METRGVIQNSSNIKLNLTIAMFEIPLITITKKSADGVIYPAFRSVRRLLDLITVHCSFNGVIVIPEEGRFGELTEHGYEDGIFGLLQSGEADISWIPVPLATPQPPGSFTPILFEDQYYLNSFPRPSSSSVNQNVAASFAFFSPSIWIITLLTVYFFDLILTYQYATPSYTTWVRMVIVTVASLPCILFNQHIPTHRAMLRSTQMILLTVVTAIFMASFSTNTIDDEREARVNTLRDIVDLDKTPAFWNGFSAHELFQARVTKDFADVYDQACRKGTSETAAGFENKYYTFSPEVVSIVSGKFGKLGSPIDATDHPYAKYSYWSTKPFHRSLYAYLANPRQNVDQITRRLNLLMSRLLQTGIPDHLADVIISDLISTNPVFIIPPFTYFKRKMTSTKETAKFIPLKLNGLKLCFNGLIMVIIIALIICLVEIIVFLNCFFCIRKIRCVPRFVLY